MSDTGSRRDFFRMAAPAVALPIVATGPLTLVDAQAEPTRLVTQDEIMDAFRFYDGMALYAEDMNLRYQLLIEMLFETNPENLRAKLQVLRDNRSKREVLVNANTGQTAAYDPAMYNDKGEYKGNRWQGPEFNKPLEGIASPTGPHIVKRATLQRWARRQFRKWTIGI